MKNNDYIRNVMNDIDERDYCIICDKNNNLRTIKGYEFNETFTAMLYDYIILGDSGIEFSREINMDECIITVDCDGSTYVFHKYI